MQTWAGISWGSLGGGAWGREKESISEGVGVGWGKSLMAAEVCSEPPPKKKVPIKEKGNLLSSQHPHLVSALEPKSDFMLLFSTK